MQGLREPGEWLCVYLLQGLAYLKQSSVPAVVKQPPRPADIRRRIIYGYEIITAADHNACHQHPQANLQKETQEYMSVN